MNGRMADEWTIQCLADSPPLGSWSQYVNKVGAYGTHFSKQSPPALLKHLELQFK